MRRNFRFSTESVAGTRDATPAFSGYIPMDTPNSFRPMTSRPFWNIMDGSGRNVPRLRGSEVIQVSGNLNNRLYWENAQYLASWATRVDTTGAVPWTTDQKYLDLASATVDFGWTFDDGSRQPTIRRIRSS
jgi:hypothetical protein